MSSITCAYCKERGHHIKVCPVLEDKNKRLNKSRNVVVPVRSAPSSATASKKVERNKFNYLYSSDEEEDPEEGEIVEESPPRLTLILPVEEEMWTRNTYGISIANPSVYVHELQIATESQGECSPYVYEPETFIFYNKYKGMSWVDIEYCSDDEM